MAIMAYSEKLQDYMAYGKCEAFAPDIIGYPPTMAGKV